MDEPSDSDDRLIAGILGGHAAASAAHEHGFGAFGHTLFGAVGGGLSGYFLQTLAAPMVKPTLVEQALLQGLTGAVAGGIVTLGVGLLKHSAGRHGASGGHDG